ncbi:MAG: transposase [Pseudomonadota bacterium]
MTGPGVGPIVSLSSIALIDDADRFRKAANVGAFLGLTLRRDQSGETDCSGRVSKCGDAAIRGLLVEAASCLIRRVKRCSALKSWAVRLAGRRAFKTAAVATARKIAVLMLRLWKDGPEFQWTKEANAGSECPPLCGERRPPLGASCGCACRAADGTEVGPISQKRLGPRRAGSPRKRHSETTHHRTPS